MPNLDSLTLTQIMERLKTDSANTSDLPLKTPASEYKKASVLIPFVRKNNQWHVLFIRRADSDRDRHSGQVAFVGGKADETDETEIHTALRETQEEIGVDPEHVIVLGQIGSHFSVSSFQITPIVATLPWPYDLTLEVAEVSSTFTIPLKWLADSDNYEVRDRQPPEFDKPIPVVYFKEYEGEILWGASAKMMVSLIRALS